MRYTKRDQFMLLVRSYRYRPVGGVTLADAMALMRTYDEIDALPEVS